MPVLALCLNDGYLGEGHNAVEAEREETAVGTGDEGKGSV